MSKAEIYRFLAAKYGFTPQEISNMTRQQQLVMLKTDETNTTTFRDTKEMHEWLKSRGKSG